MLLLSIAIMRSAYFTIPRLKREELQSTLKLELQQKLMDISAEEADLLAQVMVEVLDGLS